METEFDRKRAHLEALLDGGENSTSTRNACIAENETAFEMGDFLKEDRERNQDEISYGMLIRARREALTASLNTRAILDLTERMHGEMRAHQSEMKQFSWIVCVMLAVIIWRVW